MPHGLLTYISRLSLLEHRKLQPTLSCFIKSVRDGHFPAVRYAHLKGKPLLLALWQKAPPREILTSGLTIEETDNWEDLFLSGTEVLGSCQRLDGDPDVNKCLMAYVMDGKIRMIAVKDSRGKIVARCMIKLLLSDKTLALFQESHYPGDSPYSEALTTFAKKRAQELDLPLYSALGKGPLAFLHSPGSPVPYEYEDAGRLGITEGAYEIQGRRVL